MGACLKNEQDLRYLTHGGRSNPYLAWSHTKGEGEAPKKQQLRGKRKEGGPSKGNDKEKM